MGVDGAITDKRHLHRPQPRSRDRQPDQHRDGLLGRSPAHPHRPRAYRRLIRSRPRRDVYTTRSSVQTSKDLYAGERPNTLTDGEGYRPRSATTSSMPGSTTFPRRGSATWLHLGDSRLLSIMSLSGRVSSAPECQRPLRCGRRLGQQHGPDEEFSLLDGVIVLQAFFKSLPVPGQPAQVSPYTVSLPVTTPVQPDDPARATASVSLVSRKTEALA